MNLRKTLAVAIAGETGPTCAVVGLHTGSAVYDVVAYDAYGRAVSASVVSTLYSRIK